MHNMFPTIPRLQVSSFLPVGGFYKTAAQSEVEPKTQIWQNKPNKLKHSISIAEQSAY